MEELVELDATVVAIISGFVIPVLTGLATKYAAQDGIKGLVSLVLSIAAGAFNEIVVAGGSFDVEGLIISTVVSWLVAIASYYGIYASDGGVPNLPWKANVKTANFGVGHKLSEEPPPGFPKAA